MALPEPEGSEEREVELSGDGSHLPDARIIKATLTELSKDHVFFHYWGYYTNGNMQADPVRDYLQEMNPTIGPVAIGLPRPIISSLNTQPAERLLLGMIPKEGWPPLEQFLGSVQGVNRKNKIFWHSLIQDIPVPDVLWLEKGTVMERCPTVTVTFFGVSGTHGLYAMTPGKFLPVILPTRVRHEPEEETMKLARIALGLDEKDSAE